MHAAHMPCSRMQAPAHSRLLLACSLNVPADKQFYPDLVEKGAQLLKIDVTPEGLKLDQVGARVFC